MIGRRQCILKSLENSILNGILFGLEWHDGKVVPQPHLFPCCGGLGNRQDPKQNMVIGCGLRKRLRRTQGIIDQLQKSWGPQASQCVLTSGTKNAGILRHVSDTIKGYRPQGSVISGKLAQPSHLWSMAMACTWRFGIYSHIITLGRAKAGDLFPKQTKEPVAIFVEQVDKLWDPRYAEILEAIVTYSYHSNSFLWVEFCSHEKLPLSAANPSVKEKLTHRVSHLKSKSPYEFLDRDCISRLKSLCLSPRITSEGMNE